MRTTRSHCPVAKVTPDDARAVVRSFIPTSKKLGTSLTGLCPTTRMAAPPAVPDVHHGEPSLVRSFRITRHRESFRNGRAILDFRLLN